MTPLQLLEETIAYYSDDTSRRAADDSGCHYNKNGKFCAVGRCLKPSVNKEGCLTGSFEFLNSWGEQLTGSARENLFKKKYQNIPFFVWRQLQSLHDSASNWNENGLTKSGQEQAHILRRQFALL